MKRLLIVVALLLVAGGVTAAIFLGSGSDVHGPMYGPADIPALQVRMATEAKAQRYEEAARLRDLIRQVENRGSAAEYEGRGHMNRVLATMEIGKARLTVTGWKILGYCGILMFGARWLVQAWHRKRTGRAEMPTAFWIISLVSATMVTMYFIWGKNDSVGIIGNGLPAGVALYNLIQDLKLKRAARTA